MASVASSRGKALMLVSGAAFALSGCLGSSDGNGGGSGELEKFSVSGELSGLGPGELVLDFNGSEVTVAEDGEFGIADSVEEGSAFELKVAHAPERPLQACSISPSAGNITGDMQVQVACVTPVALSGRVSSSHGAESDIVLTAGDETFTTSADEDGIYQFEVEIADPWAVLTLDASEGEWHFRSHLGSLAGLSEGGELPADDGWNELGESQTGRVNLNHFNTAIAGQLEWMIDADSLSDEALRDAARGLKTREAANIAGALRLVTESGMALPEYADNTLDAAREHEQAVLWTRRIGSAPEQRDTTSLATVQLDEPKAVSVSSDLQESAQKAMDEASVESEGITELPDFMFVTTGHTWNEPVYASKLDFVASNVWLRDTTGEIGPGYHTLSDGDLHMDFSGVDEVFRERYALKTLEFSGEEREISVLQVDYLQQAEIEHLMDGYAGEFVRQKLRLRREYPHYEQLETENVTETSFVLLMPQGGNVVLDESEMAGQLRMAFPEEKWEKEFWHEWSEDSASQGSLADVANLETSGSGELLHMGTPFSWDVSSAGALNVRPTDGTEHYQVWMVDGESNGEGFAIVDGVHDNLSSISAAYHMYRPDDIWVTAQDLHGRWQLSELLDEGEPGWIMDYDESSQILYLGSESHADVDENSWVSNSPYRVEFGVNPAEPVLTMAQCGVWVDGDRVWEAPAEIGLPEFADEGSCADALGDAIPTEGDYLLFYYERTWQVLSADDGELYLNEHYERYYVYANGDESEPLEWSNAYRFSRDRKYEHIGDPQL